MVCKSKGIFPPVGGFADAGLYIYQIEYLIRCAEGEPRGRLELLQVLHIKANTPGVLTERKRSQWIVITLFLIFHAFYVTRDFPSHDF